MKDSDKEAQTGYFIVVIGILVQLAIYFFFTYEYKPLKARGIP